MARQSRSRESEKEADLFSIIELFSHMSNNPNLLIRIPVTEEIGVRLGELSEVILGYCSLAIELVDCPRECFVLRFRVLERRQAQSRSIVVKSSA